MSPHATNVFEDIDGISLSSIHQIDEIPSKCKRFVPRRQRRVSFAPRNEVKEIIHINDLKIITDFNDLWYTDSEYDTIQSDAMETVSDLDFGYPIDEETQCLRGLEALTAHGQKVKRQQVLSAVYAVLDEQNLQRHEGIHDMDLLADVYFEATYRCLSSAKRMALQDSTDILK